MDFKLKDKVVAVTGGTGGIGTAIVKAFLAEGSKVAFSSRSQKKIDALLPTLDAAEGQVWTAICDVTKEDEVKAFVEGAVEHFGQLDVMVVNSGYEGETVNITDATFDNYMKVFDVNVFGAVYSMKYAARELLKHNSGAIVVIASNGSYTGAPGMGAYCGSKHAVAGVTKSVALELGPEGIHVNYICPGGVETPMIHRIEKNTFGDSKTHEEAEQIFGAQYLDKRYCKPEEVADLALYLASDVSSHMMGSGIRLDGGLDALC